MLVYLEEEEEFVLDLSRLASSLIESFGGASSDRVWEACRWRGVDATE